MNLGRLFDEAAGDYDRARKRLVPCFEELYGTVLEVIREDREEEFRVLDLGAGTGLLDAMVAGAFPGARITLVDFSEKMLNVARDRLADEPEGRFEFRLMDYATEPLPGEYEVVVSALSIHHLEDADKKRVFREVYRSLSDGGVFINADQVLGESPEVEEAHHETWLRQARERGASEEDLASALARMEEDKSSTLRAQLGWMRDAGFASVGCRYENDRFAVYSGRKEVA